MRRKMKEEKVTKMMMTMMILLRMKEKIRIKGDWGGKDKRRRRMRSKM